MLSKTQVYEYLDKLQAKALAAVNKDFNAKFEAAIDAYLNDPANLELKNAVQSYNDNYAALQDAAKIINRITGKCLSFSASGIRRSLFESWSPISEDAGVVQADWSITIDKTRAEYDKVRAVVKSKRNGQAAKDSLIALGFDVEELNQYDNLPVVINPKEITVDKSLLFSFKENPGNAGL